MPRHQTSPADDVIALSDDVICTEAAQSAESLTSETNGDTDANQSTSPVLDEGYDSITHESITKLPVRILAVKLSLKICCSYSLEFHPIQHQTFTFYWFL